MSNSFIFYSCLCSFVSLYHCFGLIRSFDILFNNNSIATRLMYTTSSLSSSYAFEWFLHYYSTAYGIILYIAISSSSISFKYKMAWLFMIWSINLSLLTLDHVFSGVFSRFIGSSSSYQSLSAFKNSTTRSTISSKVNWTSCNICTHNNILFDESRLDSFYFSFK